LKSDSYILANKRLSSGKDLIEQFKKSLPDYLGNGLANRQPNDVTVTNELVIGRIGQYETVLGPLKKRRKTRRPSKHLSHAMKLVIAVEIALGSTARCHFSLLLSWRVA
jgi:hypothetical protein